MRAGGLFRVCYDFMRPENWWRNLLALRDEVDCICIGYDYRQSEPAVEQLGDRLRLGYPESYTERDYQQLVGLYRERGEEWLWDALAHFLCVVIPVAEEDIWMGLYPDDPSFHVRVLPRIVKDGAALRRIVETVPSPSNGITFCPGSLATNRGNDVLAIAEKLWPHFVFYHFRNIRFLWDGDWNGETAFLKIYQAGQCPFRPCLKCSTERGARRPIVPTMHPVCMARISILVMDWQHGRRNSSICRVFWLGRQS